MKVAAEIPDNPLEEAEIDQADRLYSIPEESLSETNLCLFTLAAEAPDLCPGPHGATENYGAVMQ